MDEDQGGEAPCWAHLLDEDGGLGQRDSVSTVRVRRIYDPPRPEDGFRVLVDRLWPRGLAKEEAAIDAWLRELAPSGALRKWYGHAPERWPEFARRYRDELAQSDRSALLAELAGRAQVGPVTLLCAARDVAHCNAEVLRRVLIERSSGAA